MKIDDRSDLSGISTPGAKGAGGVDGSGRSEGHRGADRAGSDRAELSGLAGKIAHATSVEAKDRASKVERLRQEIAAGRYQANPAEISKGVINDALTSAATAGGRQKK